jgi:hypothetical protein
LRANLTVTPTVSAVPRIFEAKKRSSTMASTVLVMMGGLPPWQSAENSLWESAGERQYDGSTSGPLPDLLAKEE